MFPSQKNEDLSLDQIYTVFIGMKVLRWYSDIEVYWQILCLEFIWISNCFSIRIPIQDLSELRLNILNFQQSCLS